MNPRRVRRRPSVEGRVPEPRARVAPSVGTRRAPRRAGARGSTAVNARFALATASGL